MLHPLSRVYRIRKLFCTTDVNVVCFIVVGSGLSLKIELTVASGQGWHCCSREFKVYIMRSAASQIFYSQEWQRNRIARDISKAFIHRGQWLELLSCKSRLVPGIVSWLKFSSKSRAASVASSSTSSKMSSSESTAMSRETPKSQKCRCHRTVMAPRVGLLLLTSTNISCTIMHSSCLAWPTLIVTESDALSSPPNLIKRLIRL
jgi:hypothetical protein